MKKIIIVLSILFLTGCNVFETPVDDNIETENESEIRELIEPLPFERTEYETLYRSSVLTVYGNKELLSSGILTENVTLFESSCVMEGTYYEAIRIFVSDEFLTVNEYLELSIHFKVDQLLRYGLDLDCTNQYTDGFVQSGDLTSVAYLQNIKETGTLNGYRLFQQLDRVGCCVIYYHMFITHECVNYQVNSATLDREYFILVNDVFYSLEDAIANQFLTELNVFENRDNLPKLYIRPEMIIEVINNDN